jgi:hypothetical protein
LRAETWRAVRESFATVMDSIEANEAAVQRFSLDPFGSNLQQQTTSYAAAVTRDVLHRLEQRLQELERGGSPSPAMPPLIPSTSGGSGSRWQ